MDRLNFAWKVDPEEKTKIINQGDWDATYERLVDFKKQHGHANVPSTYEKDMQLADWVSRQRRKYRIGKLLDNRLEKLGVGFQFNPRHKASESPGLPDRDVSSRQVPTKTGTHKFGKRGDEKETKPPAKAKAGNLGTKRAKVLRLPETCKKLKAQSKES